MRVYFGYPVLCHSIHANASQNTKYQILAMHIFGCHYVAQSNFTTAHTHTHIYTQRQWISMIFRAFIFMLLLLLGSILMMLPENVGICTMLVRHVCVYVHVLVFDWRALTFYRSTGDYSPCNTQWNYLNLNDGLMK